MCNVIYTPVIDKRDLTNHLVSGDSFLHLYFIILNFFFNSQHNISSDLCTCYCCYFAFNLCFGCLGMSRLLVHIWVLQVITYCESSHRDLFLKYLFDRGGGSVRGNSWMRNRISVKSI